MRIGAEDSLLTLMYATGSSIDREVGQAVGGIMEPSADNDTAVA